MILLRRATLAFIVGGALAVGYGIGQSFVIEHDYEFPPAPFSEGRYLVTYIPGVDYVVGSPLCEPIVCVYEYDQGVAAFKRAAADSIYRRPETTR